MLTAYACAIDRTPNGNIRRFSYPPKPAAVKKAVSSCDSCRIKLLGLDHICSSLIKGGVCVGKEAVVSTAFKQGA